MEGICAYTCPMERAADKTLMGFACLALAALSGEVPVQTVTALLLAVCASAAYELICGRVPRAASCLSCASCILLASVPGAGAALPLLAYDLPRSGWKWLAWAGPACALIPWAAGRASLGEASLLLAIAVLAEALSWRCGQELALGEKLHETQDDLSDKVLALRGKMQELEDARVSETQAAALAERTRIAREIHDSVGHMLTRLVLEVEALKVVHRDDAAATGELEELSGGLNEALSSMRTSVHALDDSAHDLGTELNRLGRESGIAEVAVDCRIEELPPREVFRCFVAVTREALTNAARHARAGRASVHVAELPGIWQLRIVNDGAVPEEASGLEEQGMGLRSMRERVKSLGGTFVVTADGKQFSVFASIPRRRQA